MPEWISGLSTFGFGAVMAVLIFVAYERLVREVVSVVQSNTKAMQELSGLITELSDRVTALENRWER